MTLDARTEYCSPTHFLIHAIAEDPISISTNNTRKSIRTQQKGDETQRENERITHVHTLDEQERLDVRIYVL